MVKQGVRKRIGDGKDTRVWKVQWLPSYENGFVTSETYKEVKNVTVNSLMQVGQREWDIDILEDLFNERDRQLIVQVPLSNRLTSDSWYWNLDSDGDFTVRSCYRCLRGEREYVDKLFWKKLWGLTLPGKVLIFLWRVCRNVLPTSATLVNRHVNIQSVCTWCHSHTEDAMHTLFTCSFAQEVWQSVGLQNLIPTGEAVTPIQYLKQVFNSNGKQQCARIGLL